jgi:hypothetical protein
MMIKHKVFNSTKKNKKNQVNEIHSLSNEMIIIAKKNQTFLCFPFLFPRPDKDELGGGVHLFVIPTCEGGAARKWELSFR